MSKQQFTASVVSDEKEIEQAVLKIENTSHIYSYDEPWSSPAISIGQGTGFVLKVNNKVIIITNAHVIKNSAYVQVFTHSGKQYVGDIVSIGDDCDLAMLTIKDPSFYKEVKALQIANNPADLREQVSAFGYPIGGKSLCVTKGTISRVAELINYAHTNTPLLATQTDTAINPGNSGGPIIKNSKVIGIAHQGDDFGQNIGYFIPKEILIHFIKDSLSGQYKGFPGLGITATTLKTKVALQLYNLDDKQAGVRVTKINKLSPAFNKLKKGDIIVAIDGHSLSSNGTYKDIHNRKINFINLINMKYIGDSCKLTIIRKDKNGNNNKKNITLKLVHKIKETDMISSIQYNKEPTYLVKSGVIFMPLDGMYISNASSNYSLYPNMHLYSKLAQLHSIQKEDKEHIKDTFISILGILPNKHYIKHNIFHEVIDEIDEIKIRSIKQLVSVLQANNNTNNYYKIKFLSGTELFIPKLPAKEEQDILNRYQIHNYCSKDIEELMHAKPLLFMQAAGHKQATDNKKAMKPRV